MIITEITKVIQTDFRLEWKTYYAIRKNSIDKKFNDLQNYAYPAVPTNR